MADGESVFWVRINFVDHGVLGKIEILSEEEFNVGAIRESLLGNMFSEAGIDLSFKVAES